MKALIIALSMLVLSGCGNPKATDQSLTGSWTQVMENGCLGNPVTISFDQSLTGTYSYSIGAPQETFTYQLATTAGIKVVTQSQVNVLPDALAYHVEGTVLYVAGLRNNENGCPADKFTSVTSHTR